DRPIRRAPGKCRPVPTAESVFPSTRHRVRGPRRWPPAPRWRFSRRREGPPTCRWRRAECRRSTATRSFLLVTACQLPCPGEIGMIVDLDPVDGTDGREAYLPARIDERLITILVVQRRIVRPGLFERCGQPSGCARLDQAGTDVLARGGSGIEGLVDTP